VCPWNRKIGLGLGSLMAINQTQKLLNVLLPGKLLEKFEQVATNPPVRSPSKKICCQELLWKNKL
jgi:hypothetical protein